MFHGFLYVYQKEISNKYPSLLTSLSHDHPYQTILNPCLFTRCFFFPSTKTRRKELPGGFLSLSGTSSQTLPLKQLRRESGVMVMDLPLKSQYYMLDI